MPVTRAEGLLLLNGTTVEDFHRLRAHGCAESARPTASEFCQRKTCSLPWLKAEPTTAGFALNIGTLSSHQNVHPYCLVHFRTTDATVRKLEMTRPGRQSNTSCKLFLLDFIQIIIIILEKHVTVEGLAVPGVPKSPPNPSPIRLPLKTRLCAHLGKFGSTLKFGFSTQSL